MSAKPYTPEQLAEMRSLVAGIRRPNHAHPTFRMLATIDAVEQERDELREAARALLADLEGATGDFPDWCNSRRGCCRLASFVGDCDQGACDEHKSELHGALEELSYAPALRHLRALLEAKP